MTTKVYRVVLVSGNDVIWVSPTIYLSKENVMFAIEEKAKSHVQYFDNTVEKYQGHKWDSVCLRECNRDNWVSVEKIYTATDSNGYKKVIGFITYEAV